MIEQLKPCPFCGEKAYMYKDKCGKYFVECDGCNTIVGITISAGWSAVYNDTLAAATGWNRRVYQFADQVKEVVTHD